MIDLSKIVQVDFPDDQYYPVECPKNQIVLHHTVSQTVNGTIQDWKNTPERVGVCMIVDRDGTMYQLYSSKFWAHHLGLKSAYIQKHNGTKTNVQLNQNSIGIEIMSWGGIGKEQGAKNLITYPEGYRGFKTFERYTDAQIESVKNLLLYWGERYNIPLDYNEDMWDVSLNALNGKSGIWSHSSFLDEKSDIAPQPNMVEMLKKLKI